MLEAMKTTKATVSQVDNQINSEIDDGLIGNSAKKKANTALDVLVPI